MSPELSIFIVVVIAVVGWFALGTHINVRKGNDVMRWLQSGLPLIGEKTTVRWLGSSVMQLQIANARAPFRRAEVLAVLEPRDVPPLWLLSRLRGRRDLLIVRGELRQLPRLRFELLNNEAWATDSVEREIKELGWPPLASSNGTFKLHAPQAVPELEQLLAEAQSPNLPLMRVSVRERNNMLELSWRLPRTNTSDARTVFEAVQKIAQRVG